MFRWVADPDLASHWQPDVTAYEITRRTEGMVGTEFVETLRGRGGAAELHGRVVARTNDHLQSVIGRILEVQGIARSTTQIAMTEQLRLRVLPLVELAIG